MKIYSYVVRYDDGVAPNPFGGYCTLAICKPRIRSFAAKGDWIVGTGSVENVGNDRLIYAMKVTLDPMSFEEYGSHKKFLKKIPIGVRGIKSLGDNIYYRDENGYFRQRFPCAHSYNDKENIRHKKHDLSGKNVLISKAGSFYYFGREAPRIPSRFRYIIKKGPGHKCNFADAERDAFVRLILRNMKPGIHGKPWSFPRRVSCKTRRKGNVKSYK